MSAVNKAIYSLVVIFFSTALLFGCSDDKEAKPAKKIETAQERIGKDAAQEIKKPIEEAVKVRSQVEGKEKKKLEGC